MEIEIDTDKIDDAVLALLYLTSYQDRPIPVYRAWKGHDWDALDRLHEKGLIDNPKSKAKSVIMSDEAHARAEQLFYELFGKRDS